MCAPAGVHPIGCPVDDEWAAFTPSLHSGSLRLDFRPLYIGLRERLGGAG
jgi:hypothetical protein